MLIFYQYIQIIKGKQTLQTIINLIILLLFIHTLSLADTSLEKKEFKTHIKSITIKSQNHFIDKKKMKKKLTTILTKVRAYKKKNQQEKEILESELNALQKELKKVQSNLDSTKKQLKKIKTQKPKIKIVEKTKIVEKIVYKEVEIPVIQEPTLKENVELVEVIVPEGINIYQLALLYYGDAKKYKELYQINKNLIGSDLKIMAGQSINIPIDLLFKQ